MEPDPVDDLGRPSMSRRPGLFRRIGNWFRDVKPEPAIAYDFDSMQWRLPSVESVAGTLKVDRNGARNGGHELPRTVAEEPDGAEERILQYYQSAVRNVTADFKKRVQSIGSGVATVNTNQRLERAESTPQDWIQHVKDETEQRRANLDAGHKHFDVTHAALHSFKATYGIARECNQQMSYWLMYGMLFLTTILEATLNAVFFQSGSEFGYLGGTLYALILAVVDVTLIFSLGKLSARMQVPGHTRLLGGIASLASVLWIVFYNLLVGHIREQLGEGLAGKLAMEAAWQNFTASPFGLGQADSWMLVAFGVFLSITAFVTGLRADDPIPGYGGKYREAKQAEWDVLNEEEALIDNIRRSREEALAILRDAVTRSEEDVMGLSHRIQTTEAMEAGVAQCIYHCRDSCVALVKRYRDENIRNRSTEPPVFFGTAVKVKFSVPSARTDLREWRSKLSAESELARGARARVDKARQRFREVEGTAREWLAERQVIRLLPLDSFDGGN